MKKSQTQKDKSCMLSLICRILKSQTHENSVLLEASGGRGEGEWKVLAKENKLAVKQD